jgi:uncharacterized protein (DUF427 family)
VIKARPSGEVLASGEEQVGVVRFEGNWYFDPEGVNTESLRMTDRIYTCPYKGVCYWVDLESADQQARNVAWVYVEPKKGYEHIKGKYGFYAGTRAATEEVSNSDQ